jgi:coproporphyrinogen III oxidase-like Fe-S oxidoreductase
VTRNCPWNRCAFCPVYKGTRYSRRSVSQVLRDLDRFQELYGDRPRTVFLQDADPLLVRPGDLLAILEGVRERFPKVERITTYARAFSLSRRSLEDLRSLREAGLDRVHVGLESGSDRVLALVDKGVTRQQQLEAGRKAKAAGFELSLYVMPGLGGLEHWEEHADETASAIAHIEPDFVRLRTTVAVPGTPLHEMHETGVITPLDEVGTLREVRRFLAGLAGVRTRLVSDHSLNLLMELQGPLPDDLDQLLGQVDEVLALAPDELAMFILARRLGHMVPAAHVRQRGIPQELAHIREQVEESGMDLETLFAELRRRWV